MPLTSLYGELPYLNLLLAGYVGLWMAVVARARVRHHDWMGGVQYALGTVVLCIGFCLAYVTHIVNGDLTVHWYSPVFTVGMCVYVWGQVRVLRNGWLHWRRESVR